MALEQVNLPGWTEQGVQLPMFEKWEFVQLKATEALAQVTHPVATEEQAEQTEPLRK